MKKYAIFIVLNLFGSSVFGMEQLLDESKQFLSDVDGRTKVFGEFRAKSQTTQNEREANRERRNKECQERENNTKYKQRDLSFDERKNLATKQAQYVLTRSLAAYFIKKLAPDPLGNFSIKTKEKLLEHFYGTTTEPLELKPGVTLEKFKPGISDEEKEQEARIIKENQTRIAHLGTEILKHYAISFLNILSLTLIGYGLKNNPDNAVFMAGGFAVGLHAAYFLYEAWWNKIPLLKKRRTEHVSLDTSLKKARNIA